jgi:hypothetical protein
VCTEWHVWARKWRRNCVGSCTIRRRFPRLFESKCSLVRFLACVARTFTGQQYSLGYKRPRTLSNLCRLCRAAVPQRRVCGGAAPAPVRGEPQVRRDARGRRAVVCGPRRDWRAHGNHRAQGYVRMLVASDIHCSNGLVVHTSFRHMPILFAGGCFFIFMFTIAGTYSCM